MQGKYLDCFIWKCAIFRAFNSQSGESMVCCANVLRSVGCSMTGTYIWSHIPEENGRGCHWSSMGSWGRRGGEGFMNASSLMAAYVGKIWTPFRGVSPSHHPTYPGFANAVDLLCYQRRLLSCWVPLNATSKFPLALWHRTVLLQPIIQSYVMNTRELNKFGTCHMSFGPMNILKTHRK